MDVVKNPQGKILEVAKGAVVDALTGNPGGGGIVPLGHFLRRPIWKTSMRHL